MNTVADEAHSLQVFDGAGRVIAKASNHPGSVGGFSGQQIIYDQMGRAIKQSNPTETAVTISGTPIQPFGWAAAGDDAQAGWLYTQQTYDWKGRPLVTTNTDSTTKTASYGGCGCAGGEVVTMTDEGTIDGGVAKRRQQKIYSDVLGRPVKTEALNWEGGSVYSTTVNTYNARDQVTQVRQYQGADTSSVYQDTMIDYDGYGRLLTKHLPEQNAGTATVYSYNQNDTVNSVTDARGATCVYGYNSRHQVTSATHTLSGQSTISVSYSYDAAGNRTSMTDGLGSMSYSYNQLSQLMSETRTFPNVGTFTLSYDYNLAGELKKITDPTNMTINYSYDSTGRMTNVTGSDSLYASVSNYASSFQYRAWGDLKHMQYGNALTLNEQFNSRLQVTSFQIPGLMTKSYDYYADARVKHSFNDAATSQFDRSYSYDQMGRVTQAASGPAARGEADTIHRPYLQSYTYDGFDHLTSRTGLWWRGLGGVMSGQQYQNERNTAWSYDADGRLTIDPNVQYGYDAAGRAIHVDSVGQSDLTQSFDGDGERAQSVEVTTIENEDGTTSSVTTTRYYLRSSTLKQVVTELDEQGVKQRGFVYQGSAVLAWQEKLNNVPTVEWEHREPSNASFRMTTAAGYAVLDRSAELDPTGANRGVTDPFQFSRVQPQSEGLYPAFDNGAGSGATQCRIDGVNMPCDVVLRFFLQGSGDIREPEEVRTRFHQSRRPDSRAELNDYWRSLPWRTEYSAPQSSAIADAIARSDAQVDAKYAECVKRLGRSPAPSTEATKAILSTTILEGGSSTLVAVTWLEEGSFSFNPDSNPNDGSANNADIGPMGINYRTFHDWAPLAGLGNVFGTTTTGKEVFNGNAYDNLRAGARILNSYGTGRTAAGRYRAGTGDFSRKPAGRAEFSNRAAKYDRWAAGYDAFFNCLRGR